MRISVLSSDVCSSDLGSLLRRTPIDMLLGNWNLDASPVYLMLDLLGRVASPYEFNPLNLNPLRELLDELVDFERVRACTKMKIFVSATNVETGRAKIDRKSTRLNSSH